MEKNQTHEEANFTRPHTERNRCHQAETGTADEKEVPPASYVTARYFGRLSFCMQIIYCSLACELETNEDQSAKNNTGSQIRSCLLLLNGEESRFPTVAPWPASTAWLAARCEGHRTSTERRACAFRLPGSQSHQLTKQPNKRAGLCSVRLNYKGRWWQGLAHWLCFAA